jgi:hypothetical protein
MRTPHVAMYTSSSVSFFAACARTHLLCKKRSRSTRRERSDEISRLGRALRQCREKIHIILKCRGATMKLYASVRVLRGVALGALTHDPAAAAVVAELASVTPLCYNATATVGGVLALAYSGTRRGPSDVPRAVDRVRAFCDHSVNSSRSSGSIISRETSAVRTGGGGSLRRRRTQ